MAARRSGLLVDDEVRTLGDDLEVVVGDERRDLDDHVARGIEPRHLEVHPRQHRATVGGAYARPMPFELPVLVADSAVTPGYARPGDAGLDLSARIGVVLEAGGGRALVPTGISVAIPLGWAGFVQPRSGLALRHGVTVLNAPGLIDAGYRDELAVILVNTDPYEDYEVRPGDRIAQLVIQRVEQVSVVVVERLAGENRGGGFGHTGS
jgi:dUTP pyrophosphatase